MFEQRVALIESLQDRDWREILEKNYDNYAEFKKLYDGNFFSQANKKLKELLPSYFEVFHLINQHNVQENKLPDFAAHPYDLGIYLVGGSIMPIILSLAEIKPKSVIMVTTAETTRMVENEIKPALPGLIINYSDNHLQVEELTDLSDPARVYQKINEFLIEHKGRKIAVDITGGKKTMVAGAFLASAHNRKCDIFYVDFEEYDYNSREPVYNTEFLAQLPNPAEIFGIVDRERLQSLFDNHRYIQALEELKRIQENIEKNPTYFAESDIRLITTIEKYAKAYECWDDYRYHEAFNYLAGDPALCVLKQTKSLEDKDIYNNSELFAYYILDRCNNAERRELQGHYQGAFLRYITLIEFILIVWAENELPAAELVQIRYKKGNGDIIFGGLLKLLEDKYNFHEILSNIKLSEIIDLKNYRNSHVLIHSTKLIAAEGINTTKEITKQLIENILEHKSILNHIHNIRQDLQFKTFGTVTNSC